MRPRTQRRNPALEYGVLLLLGKLYSIGYDAIPPVTLTAIVYQILLYIGLIDTPWNKWDVCISGKKIWESGDYKILFLSVFEHADDMHLYYNMISFLVKGQTLEYKYKSINFALLLVILTFMTSGIYVLLAVSGAKLLHNYSLMNSCAIGFSGVIFALKLITTLENPVGIRHIQGIPVPTKYAAWAELIAIHVLVPNASFLGHLAGILAGLVYMKTYIGTLIDYTLYNITGYRIYHGSRSYSSQQSSYSRENGSYYNHFSSFGRRNSNNFFWRPNYY